MVVIGAVLALALSASALGARSKPGKKPKLPHVVYIRYQLSESFQRSSPSEGTVKLTATGDVVQEVSAGNLGRDTIVHGVRLISSEFNAEVPSGSGGTCVYTGKLTSHSVAEVNLVHSHHRTYGLVTWPVQHDGSYVQKTNSPGCQVPVLISPLEGTKVLSSPGVGSFSSMERFENAIFPVSVPKGQRKIKVSMSSDENFGSETDQTRANGLITISYGRCPSGLKRCKPTNGKP